MYKAIAYPYDSEFTSILRHSSLLRSRGIEIAAVISPKGWGLCRHDASFADNGSEIGMTVLDKSGFDSEEFDALLLVDSDNALDFDSVLFPAVEKCAEMHKKILSARCFSDCQKARISAVCLERHVEFVDFADCPRSSTDPFTSKKLMDFSTPVIFVCGTTQNTGKFEIQLALREELQKRGYAVSQIGSRCNCSMLGFHSWPDFMADRSYSENDKISMLNHSIKHVELSENPDLLIVGIPGGLFPLDQNSTIEFGMTAQEVSLALVPDYAVLSVPYENYEQDFFEKIDDGVKNRFGFEIDVNNLSNVWADFQDLKSHRKIAHLRLPASLITASIPNATDGQPIVNIFDNKAPEFIADHLIETLTHYAGAMTV